MKSNKWKDFFINTCKGIGIGVSMIIPGVSGGTMAVLMNIYDKILDAITGIFKNFKTSFIFLLPLALGAIIGLLGLVPFINIGLKNFPLITVSLFVGFIIGGLPFIYKEVERKESLLNIIVFLLCGLLVVSLCFIKTDFELDVSTLNFGNISYLFLAGVASSIALVAPGISGSMTLMVMGVYFTLTTKIEEILSFTNLGHNILIFIPLGLGLIVGFAFMSLLMKYLLKNHKVPTYYGILGLIIGSIVTIYYVTITDSSFQVKLDGLNITLSVIILIGGMLLTYFIEKYAIDHSQKEKE